MFRMVRLYGSWHPMQLRFSPGRTQKKGSERRNTLPPAPKATTRRALTVTAICLGLWWLPVLAASRAREELQRRGCTEVYLELARRLFDRDPEVRKELARALPKLRNLARAGADLSGLSSSYCSPCWRSGYSYSLLSRSRRRACCRA